MEKSERSMASGQSHLSELKRDPRAAIGRSPNLKTMNRFASVITVMKCPWPSCSSFFRGNATNLAWTLFMVSSLLA